MKERERFTMTTVMRLYNIVQVVYNGFIVFQVSLNLVTFYSKINPLKPLFSFWFCFKNLSALLIINTRFVDLTTSTWNVRQILQHNMGYCNGMLVGLLNYRWICQGSCLFSGQNYYSI